MEPIARCSYKRFSEAQEERLQKSLKAWYQLVDLEQGGEKEWAYKLARDWLEEAPAKVLCKREDHARWREVSGVDENKVVRC